MFLHIRQNDKIHSLEDNYSTLGTVIASPQYPAFITNLKDGCVFFRILGFFVKKTQNLSIIVSICPIVSWVGAFASSDDEATFFILLYGDKTYRKFSRDPQSCQLLLILWFILRNLYKMLVFSTYTQIFHKISKSWQLWGSLEIFRIGTFCPKFWNNKNNY